MTLIHFNGNKNLCIFWMTAVLKQQVRGGDYRIIHELWKYSGCKVDVIKSAYRGDNNVSTSPRDAIICDAVDVIARKARANSEVLLKFCELMEEKYPDAYKACEKLCILADENKSAKFEKNLELYWLQAGISREKVPKDAYLVVGPAAEYRKPLSSRCMYCIFLIYYSGLKEMVGPVDDFTLSYCEEIARVSSGTDKDNLEYSYRFADGEPVFTSMVFNNFVWGEESRTGGLRSR